MPRSRQSTARSHRWPVLVGVLCLAGLAISLYLWSAKAGASSLICGPLGDCVSVNASAYSEVLGVPVAAVGATLYGLLALLAALVHRSSDTSWYAMAGVVPAVGGALYSWYLTGVEAFVLHAYCVWCVVSCLLISVVAITWTRQVWRATARQSSAIMEP